MRNKYSIVIFGTGSIGRRHYEIAKKIPQCKCFIFSRSQIRNNKLQKIGYQIFNFKETCDLGIIATESSNHSIDYAIYSIYARKWLVEKPIISINNFNEKIQFNRFSKKNIFVGYNKRFESGIKELKKLISKNKLSYAHFKCFSNLNNWRNQDISKSISLKKDKGGGVINELSHEIDLANFLIGGISKIDGITKQRKYKLSDVEDTAFLKLNHNNGIKTKVDISFGCEKDVRKVILYFGENKIIYNHLTGDIFKIINNKKYLYKNLKEDRNKSFERQINALLKDDFSFSIPCSSYDGLSYIKLSKHLAWK